MSGSKIISDPVFGFIRIPSGLLLNIVKHPFMQRLTRIKQLGLTTVVYPGAQHTRFQHSLGAFHLMSEATLSLQHKGVFIFDSEAEAVQAAILMHDIGHGPFSHVLENTLIKGITHEEISLMVMNCINQEMNGDYPKRVLHQLISSQLDMDRLDYLKRDSFFTGVTEGNIGSARIIKMLNVVDDTLVIDDKGIYSIENFLTSRRLMYWQVYLHKATVGYEKLLISLLLRAKKLLKDGYKLFASPALTFFLDNDVNAKYFKDNEETLQHYLNLDDSDLWSAIKVWQKSEDKILSLLADDFINRKLFKVEIHDEPISQEQVNRRKEQICNHLGISEEESNYLMQIDTIQKDMYDINDDRISILSKDGSLKDITEASEILNVELLSKKIRKYYFCYHRI